MFGLLGKIFGSEKATNTMIEGLYNGIDKLYYSDEEKAEDAANSRAEARKMIIAWMDTTKGQNLARRLIAFIITIMWVLITLIALTVSIYTIFADPAITAQLKEVSKILDNFSERMTGAMMLILAFYFAAPHIGQVVGAAINKFKK